MAKKVTLENLADKMDKGFEGMDKKFEKALENQNKSIKRDFKDIILEALKDQSQSIIDAVDFGFENVKKDRAEAMKDQSECIIEAIDFGFNEAKKDRKEMKEESADTRKIKADDIKVVQLEERVGKLELAIA